MVPVMIGSLLLGGARYSVREYLAVLAIIGGTCIISMVGSFPSMYVWPTPPEAMPCGALHRARRRRARLLRWWASCSSCSPCPATESQASNAVAIGWPATPCPYIHFYRKQSAKLYNPTESASPLTHLLPLPLAPPRLF